MKKIVMILVLFGVMSCSKNNCYECYYQYYNSKLDSSNAIYGIECGTEKEIKQIEYKNNAKCIKK